MAEYGDHLKRGPTTNPISVGSDANTLTSSDEISA